MGTLRDPDSRFSLRVALEGLTKRMTDQGLPIVLTITGDESDYNRSTLVALFRATQGGAHQCPAARPASQVKLDLVFRGGGRPADVAG